ncbi:protein kinase-like protein [Pochonia chlamydosporia 170]|uniref:Protein kinase-like protein n=1 Tax=Pochonia chlamydosporia 170 TaxID=1380566 RepID=A0A179FXD0_METCM|nr:protein kinase-like protein [Pochonia chlamydosporia 170]OAQ70282.1 protein kinase-like protein [Pochonia chlamydosporia 170]
MKICQDARHVFKHVVPETIYIGSFNGTATPGNVHDPPLLHIYLIEKLPGVPLSSVLQNRSIHSKSFRQHLIQDLARIFATSCHHRILPAHPHAKGRIGSSLHQRVDLLTTMSDVQLASEAQAVRDYLPRIEQLPWCLTHGDLIPSNIMVDPDTGHITGLLDWAEGEWLPLGVGMYAVDECLGRDDPDKGFLYFEDHEELRMVFWQTFLGLCECTAIDDGFKAVEVEMARRLGVLLWRGIAFDNGRLDRLVEEGRDDVEMGKLRVLLDAPSVLSLLTVGQVEHVKDVEGCCLTKV